MYVCGRTVGRTDGQTAGFQKCWPLPSPPFSSLLFSMSAGGRPPTAASANVRVTGDWWLVATRTPGKSNQAPLLAWLLMPHPSSPNPISCNCSNGVGGVKRNEIKQPHITATMELSFNSSWLLVGSRLFRLQNFPCSVSFWCMFGGHVEVWTKNLLCRFIEGQTHFGKLNRC